MVEIDPEDAQAHFNLGEIYYDAGDLAAAEQACRKALACDPGFSFAYMTLGNICLDQEKPRQALDWFQKFLLHERSAGAADIREEVAAVVAGLKEELGQEGKEKPKR